MYTYTCGESTSITSELLSPNIAVSVIPLAFMFKNSTFCPQFIYMLCMYRRMKKELKFFLYSTRRLVSIKEETGVYCAVRTGSLNKFD